MTQELILSGADIVKVGIGPGSVCTTRIQTGVGYPQLSAVIECADAAHGLGAHMIADGGCTCPGDVAKAFGGGADFVMLGGMLAGHKEGGGKVITKNGQNFIEFYGSSSEEANTKHYGGLADYRSSEGKKVSIPLREKLETTVKKLIPNAEIYFDENVKSTPLIDDQNDERIRKEIDFNPRSFEEGVKCLINDIRESN